MKFHVYLIPLFFNIMFINNLLSQTTCHLKVSLNGIENTDFYVRKYTNLVVQEFGTIVYSVGGDKDTTVNFDVNISSPDYLHINYKKPYKIYCRPGENLKLEFNENSVKISVNNHVSPENEVLKRLGFHTPIIKIPSTTGLSFQQKIDFIDSLGSKKWAIFNEYESQYDDQDFLRLLKAEIIGYMYYVSDIRLFTQIRDTIKQGKFESYNLDYYNRIRDLPMIDEHRSQVYLNCLNFTINDTYKSDLTRDQFENYYIRIDKKSKVIDSIFGFSYQLNRLFSFAWVNNLIYLSKSLDEIQYAQYHIDQLKNDLKNEPYNHEINLLHERLKGKNKQINFTKSDNYEFQSMDSRENIVLDLIESNVIVIDIWASWCKPCIEKMPLFDSLARVDRPYSSTFLALSVQCNKTGVKNVIEKLNTKNILYNHADRALSEKLVSEWHLDSYPSYLVLDNDLNVLYYTQQLQDLKFFLQELKL